MLAAKEGDGKPRGYIDRNGGPANPIMPEETDSSIKLLDQILDGNENLHLYDPVLIALAEVKRIVAEEEAIKNGNIVVDDAPKGKAKKKKRRGEK